MRPMKHALRGNETPSGATENWGKWPSVRRPLLTPSSASSAPQGARFFITFVPFVWSWVLPPTLVSSV